MIMPDEIGEQNAGNASYKPSTPIQLHKSSKKNGNNRRYLDKNSRQTGKNSRHVAENSRHVSFYRSRIGNMSPIFSKTTTEILKISTVFANISTVSAFWNQGNTSFSHIFILIINAFICNC